MNGIQYTLLAVGAIIGSWTDIREHKLPNQLTLSMAVCGLVLAGICSGFDGMRKSVLVCVATLAVGMLLWLVGVFRAGDAKLFSAMGAISGSVLWQLDCFTWAVLLGTIAGIVLLLRKRELPARFRRVWSHIRLLLMTGTASPYTPAPESIGELPFAPFLGLGVLLAELAPLWRT